MVSIGVEVSTYISYYLRTIVTGWHWNTWTYNMSRSFPDPCAHGIDATHWKHWRLAPSIHQSAPQKTSCPCPTLVSYMFWWPLQIESTVGASSQWLPKIRYVNSIQHDQYPFNIGFTYIQYYMAARIEPRKSRSNSAYSKSDLCQFDFTWQLDLVFL